jgi:hypothetical protein
MKVPRLNVHAEGDAAQDDNQGSGSSIAEP